MEKWMKDIELRIRPGDFKGNAKVLMEAVRAFARSGVAEMRLPCDAICGGDCGSLADHPAFRRELEAAQRKFLAAAATVRNAPKITFKGTSRPSLVGAGDDPRLPFCGQPGDVFARQVAGLARRLAAIGCRDVAIGISGGLDSTLALLVAMSAFQLLELDKRGIHVYTMPGFGTTRRTRGNAKRLCKGLGLDLETIDITQACRRHFRDIGHPESLHDVVFENAQARERTQVLMDKANQTGGIVLGTGDMSEIALGWCTYNGDHMSMFGVNAGVPKTAVRDVCGWWAREATSCAGSPLLNVAADAILDIIDTPVSPELLPSSNGEIEQKTESKIGPYELHDFFLWHLIAEREGEAEMLKAAKKAFRGTYDAATIAKWLDLFLSRLFSQAFKRNCAPDGVQVFPVYLSPSAWHVPGDMARPRL